MQQNSLFGSEEHTLQNITDDERTMAILCHILTLFAPILAPLIIYLVKKDDSAFVAEHAKESLNFQITMALLCIALVFTIIGLLFIWLVGIFILICVIIASVKASDKKIYRYPMTWRLVK
ncbi:DUF4870 domain-containing protein [Aridibaculum aurantiacum]|uniref:DUF4870 domain-containing protein n=1 Tax=Aridibaculum aurantiacum TaxID=2810307 RepID=UPI001A975E21|nr:DUF4870 domain-containing protein [Aridibaculum aurantiacum]